jgi:tyrosyl-tRNA synthetase
MAKSSYLTDIWTDLQQRGLLYQSTSADLAQLLTTNSLTCYCGFDPTGNSLHVGHLLPLLTLARFQRAGHRPIAVAGGATGMIGDPSGRSSERNLLTRDEIAANIASIQPQLAKLLDFDCGTLSAIIVNNDHWLSNFNLLEFLRDVGKHFTINDMLSKDSVQLRLANGISYTEFSYMLLQAYDFYHLHQNYHCQLQIGGSDQWGNIVAGIELIRRTKQQPAYGLTLPLIKRADGQKFGKTATGTQCWLDPQRTSPYRFYQFFIQAEDRDVINFLHYFTFLPLAEIAALAESCAQAPEKREAQRALAQALTELVHGVTERQRAEAAAQALFGGDLATLDERTLLEVFEETPATELTRDWFTNNRLLVDALVTAQVETSKAAARQSIQGGGIYLNNERISDVRSQLTPQYLLHDKYLIVRRGKRNYYLIRCQD